MLHDTLRRKQHMSHKRPPMTRMIKLQREQFMYTIQQSITMINQERSSPSSPLGDSTPMSQPETITRQKKIKKDMSKIPKHHNMYIPPKSLAIHSNMLVGSEDPMYQNTSTLPFSPHSYFISFFLSLSKYIKCPLHQLMLDVV